MKPSTKRRAVLFLGATFFCGCIGSAVQEQGEHGFSGEIKTEARTAGTNFNSLGDFLDNKKVIEAARVAEQQGFQFDFQTGENPPNIEGFYTLNWQRNQKGSGQETARFHWFEQRGNLISCNSYDENALLAKTFIHGTGSHFTTYSVCQITVNFEGTECRTDNVLIFDGRVDQNGNLETHYLAIPVYNHTPDACQGFESSSGRAFFKKEQNH
ncbi:MAG: hypothetical protein KJ600_02820 [Nanoarchaeota archaeon]|nr:hypothetical protein [Nanoarchaeota archaeon]